MSRLAMCGAELEDPIIEGLTVVGTVGIDTSAPYGTGHAAYTFGDGDNRLIVPFTGTAGRTYYGRVRFYYSGAPSADVRICAFSASVNYQEIVTLKTTGKIQGTDGTTLTGSALSVGYHTIDVKLVFTSTTSWSSECRVDGTVLNTRASHNPGSLTPDRFTFGNVNAATHGLSLKFDDVILQDDQGGANNGYPDTAEMIRYAKPIGNSAVGSDWVAGAGGAAGFGSVDNIPITGKSNATAADGDQIRNAAASQTDPAASADFTCQSYTTAAGETVGSVVATRSVAAIALASGGTARALATKIVSNPADAAEATGNTGTSGAGTYPLNWGSLKGNATDSPSVVNGTSPVVRIAKRATSSTLLCCAVGVMFGYVPPSGPTPPTTGQLWPRGWKDTAAPASGQLFPRRVIT